MLDLARPPGSHHLNENDAIAENVLPDAAVGDGLACLSRLEAWLRPLWVAMMS